MRIKTIPSIHGALAREDGAVKMPDTTAKMPHGGVREYKTKWIFGAITKASKTARHSYRGTSYRGKNYKIHRLICEAFHGPKPSKRHVVIHENEDALDNRPQNLRWGTQKENLNMPGFIEYCRSRTGENSPIAKSIRKKATESSES